jgi:hypothetical protein
MMPMLLSHGLGGLLLRGFGPRDGVIISLIRPNDFIATVGVHCGHAYINGGSITHSLLAGSWTLLQEVD